MLDPIAVADIQHVYYFIGYSELTGIAMLCSSLIVSFIPVVIYSVDWLVSIAIFVRVLQ